MSLSDWLLITSTLIGPIAAVQAQKWIERAREQRSRKLGIFRTLMATRAIRAGSAEHVQALNLIEVFFDGKGAKEKAVRDRWADYLDFLVNERVDPKWSEAESKTHNDKGVDLLVSLLEAMGLALGYHFNKVQLRRGGYYPQGHFDEMQARNSILNGLMRVFRDGHPVPMAVTSFPVSEDALKAQMATQHALLETLSGKKPLRVKLGDPLGEDGLRSS